MKDIPGYEGHYAATEDGRVWSYKNSLFRKYSFSRGYAVVPLSKEGHIKTCRVNRLIAKTFIPNPENKGEVNHKNGIKNDDRVENLEWVTPKENMQHALANGLVAVGSKSSSSKRTEQEILEIRKLHREGLGYRKIGRLFSMRPQSVKGIVKRVSWKHLP